MKLSIIIPTYNRANVILRAVKSVFSQSFQNFELVIIDDGSSDNTSGIISKMMKKHRQIKYIWLKKNKGFYIARNEGIKKAKGDWLSFLDSDDEYLPGALKTIASELKKLDKNIKIAQFKILAKKPDGSFKQFGYLPLNSNWRYYYPKREDIALKTHLHGDMHRCIRAKTAKANLFSENNPGLETLHYADLAKKGIKSVYINKNAVQVNQDCENQHNLIRFREWPRQFAHIYSELVGSHYDIFKKQKDQLFDHSLTIAKCYLNLKNPLAVWWLSKAFFYQPKRFIAAVWSNFRMFFSTGKKDK